jgi:cytochrome c oxidase subunit 2
MRSPAARSRLRSVPRIGLPLLLVGLLGGCLLPPLPKTDAGRDVFNLYLVILGLAAIVFVGVEGFIIYAIFRYRRRPGDDDLPPQHHGNNVVELIWTAIPSVIVLILFVASMITLGTVNARSQNPTVEIEVEGFQWNWIFHYPEGVRVGPGTADAPPTLYLPVGEPIRLRLHAADVIHAFFVPDFLIKRDLIPAAPGGHMNELEFTITEAGTYAGQCAEFCGTQHAEMTFTVEAMARPDYDAWFQAALAGETPPPTQAECATTIELTAESGTRFNTDQLEAPAGEDFCIELTNNDSVPHDVGIYDGGTSLFDGEDLPAGQSIVYQIPALEAGDYQFICNLHPTVMVGDLTATE